MFGDPAMTVAAIDHLVHHAIILEMNTDSYRRRSAEARATARQTTLQQNEPLLRAATIRRASQLPAGARNDGYPALVAHCGQLVTLG